MTRGVGWGDKRVQFIVKCFHPEVKGAISKIGSTCIVNDIFDPFMK